jgi:hypothetical protein
MPVQLVNGRRQQLPKLYIVADSPERFDSAEDFAAQISQRPSRLNRWAGQRVGLQRHPQRRYRHLRIRLDGIGREMRPTDKIGLRHPKRTRQRRDVRAPIQHPRAVLDHGGERGRQVG